MNEVILPPSPNWYLSSILDCASDGTAAWGARNIIVIAKVKNDNRKLEYSIIDRAHSEKVTSVAFSPEKENGHYRLVSSADENVVKLWNLKEMSLEMKNSKLDNKHKIIGVDWSKINKSLICFVSQDGFLVTWNISYDASQLISLGKMNATCLACCPHDGNIVSIGTKTGLVYIIDIRGSGNIIYKLRGHDKEIVSLSWCPVPINIFDDQNAKELLLASGAKDRNIFLWKAGSDGRCQKQIPIPTTPLDLSSHKARVSAAAGNYTAVCWLESTFLVTSSPWGELLLWDLSKIGTKRYSPQLLHGIHGKGLFSIAGLVNNCIKTTEDTENDNWRMKTSLKAVWTAAQDRQVVCCSLMDSEIKIENVIPTQGGFVYSISACPVDTSQIAFGVGDAMIRLWNLSELHESKIELKMLWEKINGKVSALAWHPDKENLLAFGTNEGRIGVIDTNVKKPPVLYKQYHRRIVYRIGWGRAPNVKDFALYTCGDGELVYYNPEKSNEDPVLVTEKKECSEFAWNPDYSLLALGFGDGSINFLNSNLSECGKTIHVLNKLIQCLAWHPHSTSSDLNISPMQHYLAVAMSGTPITIFDISIDVTDETRSDKLFYKTVATLNGHSEKVVCLAWSPHFSGYLVSGSYDCTAQVWRVEKQELIASYTLHSGPIQCCMWSPFSQDLIMTGSADLSLRMWSITNQKIIIPPVSKTLSKGKRTKKKKLKESINGDAKDEIQVKKVEMNNDKERTKEDQVVSDSKLNECKLLKKKKIKKTTHFPGYAEVKNDNKKWCSMVRALLNTLDKENEDTNENSMIDSMTTENTSITDTVIENSEIKIPILLGNKQDLEDALNFERNILTENLQHNVVTEIDLWSGKLRENLQKASREKRLNDFLVSLAPSISFEFWKETCIAYAMQLILEENPHKAVSYFLCANKVYEAIDIFVGVKLYKEAYVLASSRLDSQDLVINNILRGWVNNAQKDGHFQNVAECYLKLGDYAKAIKTLERRKDFDCLILAINIAESLNDFNLKIMLAEKAILESLTNSNVEAAKSVIKMCPETEDWNIEIEIFKELGNALDNTNNQTIINWIKGSSDISLLKTLQNKFTNCSEKYSFLKQKDICSSPTDEKLLQISVGHQLALFITADQEKLQLQYIVKALDIISQYEKTEFAKNKTLILPKYLVILDSKNITDSNSIFNRKEHDIAISLRSYLCYTIANWFVTSNLSDDQLIDCTNFVLNILKECIEDLFNKECIKFWTTTNEISKLEYQLSLKICRVSNSEYENVDETKIMIERLDQLKTAKKAFIENRISSPNPMLSYDVIIELLSQISDDTVHQEINEFIMNVWKKSIQDFDNISIESTEDN